jgi:hypothetical protein
LTIECTSGHGLDFLCFTGLQPEMSKESIMGLSKRHFEKNPIFDVVRIRLPDLKRKLGTMDWLISHLFGAQRQIKFGLGLCEKSFIGASRQINV